VACTDPKVALVGLTEDQAKAQGSVGANVNAIAPAPEPVPPKLAAHCPWAVLIARIYEVSAVGGCARGGCAAYSFGTSSFLGCCGRSNLI
jgi:NAD(P)-dependent dehydrogenase (short-subunit alcohol dehydrogenase family)